ncbi:histidine kinase [Leifsonia sp. NPDC058230]|uniref:PAS domain-containing sensor histidine kinase n=1 Tax=Leifsonia sp. NPDC058230 TaxID=3346391 RepID=UPI0036DD1F43
MPADRDQPVSSRLDELIPAVLDKTSQPVWVVGDDGRVLYANPAALRALGHDDLATVEGLPSHTVLHPTHPEGSPYPVEDCRMLDAARFGTAVNGEDWLKHADGTFFPVSWMSAPIEFEHGRGIVLSFTNLTTRLELERESRERELAELRRSELRAAHIRLMKEVDEARRQIARDLHDGAQQRLVALALSAQLLRQTAELDDSALILVDGLVEDAQAAIGELRELVAGIHPPVLTSRGLYAAVCSLGDRFTLPLIVSGDIGDRRLPPLIESNVYFFIAEAVTNAVKYSAATRVRIRLDLADALEIEVDDDGIGGVDYRLAGTGLHSMRDRVQAFEGEFTIASSEGVGTRILARIPVAGIDQALR